MFKFKNGDVSPSMKIDKAWAAGYSGKGITIAVLDDGLQTDHPDLAANIVSTHYYYYISKCI